MNAKFLVAALLIAAWPTFTPTLGVAAPAKKASPGAKPTAKKVVAKSSPASLVADTQAKLKKQNERVYDCATLAVHAENLFSVDEVELNIGKHSGRNFVDLDLDKSEYETTEQYQTRYKTTVQKYFGDTSKAVFVLPVPDNRMTYNADEGELRVQPFPNDPDGTIALTAREFEKKVKTERGQTAMGVKFDYEVWFDYRRTIEISGRLAADQENQIVHIPVATAKAPITKAGMMYVVFGELIEPYHVEDNTTENASLSEPYYTLYQRDNYLVSGKCVLLYDALHSVVRKAYYLEPNS